MVEPSSGNLEALGLSLVFPHLHTDSAVSRSPGSPDSSISGGVSPLYLLYSPAELTTDPIGQLSFCTIPLTFIKVFIFFKMVK